MKHPGSWPCGCLQCRLDCTSMASLTLKAMEGIPMVQQGDDLAELILRALEGMGLELRHGDIVTVCQKIVSKAEGRVVNLADIEPSELALKFAARWDKD